MTDSLFTRFKKSMEITYEKWHDGVGYDIEALKQASPKERDAIEDILLNRAPLDWRDVEALSILKTKKASHALRIAAKDSNPEIRMAVVRYSPESITNEERLSSTLDALRSATFFKGLTQTLDQVEEYHPPEVIDELLNGALNREGEVAVHFAAILYYIHGKSESSFDMKKRSFFLRFATPNKAERREAFKELCSTIGVNSSKYIVE